MRIASAAVALVLSSAVAAHALAAASAGGQNPPRPRPFPGAAPPSAQTTPADPAEADPALGVPMYPGAVLLSRYEAGPGQQMFLYGTSSGYANVVEYYRGVLKDRGRELFGGPMHQFDLGRYRRETMMLQPAVTVKDFTWNGRDGFVHVTGRQIVKYPTVIQVVPAGADR
ncbi:MAG TPA: hypothetical protein VFZ36_04110 [Vicinamibacterales bacterium]